MSQSPHREFSPVDEHSVAGITYTILKDEAGTTLELSPAGAAALAEDHSLATLINQVGETDDAGQFALKDRDILPSPDFEPLRMPRKPSQASLWHHPTSASVVKCYSATDHPASAPLQFRAMTWLAQSLDQAPQSGPVRLAASRQVGLLTSPSGQQRAIMDRAPGQSLRSLGRPDTGSTLSTEERARLITELPDFVDHTLPRLLGRGALLVNDRKRGDNHSGNYIVDDTSPESQRLVTIIDQPYTDSALARARGAVLLRSIPKKVGSPNA